jgi:chaperonin GroES
MQKQKKIDKEKLLFYSKQRNVADFLEPYQITKIAGQLMEEIDDDIQSRATWKNQLDDALTIARQELKEKNHPWRRAANIKYPLILNGCISFNSRTRSELIRGNDIVHVAVMCEDKTDELADKAYRQSRHMSYQLKYVIDNWVSDTDKLLMSLPLLGTVFRKTYFDPIRKLPCVDFCLPDAVVLDQSTKSLKMAPRVTHLLKITNNHLIERMRAKYYLQYDIKELQQPKEYNDEFQDQNIAAQPSSAKFVELKIQGLREAHCFLDLDNDGYDEPYIVTLHESSGKLFRITARFDSNSFLKDSGKTIGIEPRCLFTDFHFMPSVDNSFMGLGFGQFLYPLNEAINSNINALTDAATLSNLSTGFISDTIKMENKTYRMEPGEWVRVNLLGKRMQDAIMKIPANEPSQTLFNLTTFLITSAEKLAAISDPMQGQLPPANTPATSVLAVLREGQKVFSTIFARLYDCFAREFQKLYDLNCKYLKATENYAFTERGEKVISGIVRRGDYDSKIYGVFPVADPNSSSDSEKFVKAQALMMLKDDPNVNGREVIKMFVELLRIQDSDKLIMPPPDPNAPPPPADQFLLAQAQELKTKSSKNMMEMEHEVEQAVMLEKRYNLDVKKLELEALIASTNASSLEAKSIAELAKAEADLSTIRIDQATKLLNALQQRLTMEYGQPIEELLAQQQQQGQAQQAGGAAGMPGQMQPPIAGQAGAPPAGLPEGGGSPTPPPPAGAPPEGMPEGMPPGEGKSPAEESEAPPTFGSLSKDVMGGSPEEEK